MREERVSVVGGVNIDIGGVSSGPLVDRDSNPGKVNFAFGGVGRNISHNLALLGRRVRLFTALGDDMYAAQIEENCQALGIDLSAAVKAAGHGTSTYLFISDRKGEMALAVSDMELCEQISPAYLRENLSLINDAGVLVLDTNIPEPSVRFLVQNGKIPIFADPVSVTKAEKLRGSLSGIHTLTPNVLEAQKLSGMEITDEKSLRLAARRLMDAGVKRVFITMGEKGVFAAEEGNAAFFPAFPARALNATGAGDAFTAGLVHAFLLGLDFEDTARFALAAAAVSTESRETINPLLSEAEIEKRMREEKK